ncbi:MAG: glycosyltransferase family 9 protein [Bacteroidota bacterium]
MIPKKILIIRLSSIGDIVLTTPVIRCLKKQLPDTEIHYLTKKSFSILLESNPHISNVHLLEGNLAATIQELKKENFDFIIDLHHNLRTFIIKWQLALPVRSFNKLNFRKWLLINLKWNRMPDKHIVHRYLKTTKTLGVTDDGEGLDYFIPKKDEVKIHELPLTHLHGYAALVIGAQHATKKLPFEKLKELCATVTLPLMVIGDKNDFATGNELEKLFPFKVFNGCGKFNLNQSASLVRQSKLVITHDTSMMHIAAAFKKKIHVYWGNTVPALGMYPYFGNKIKYAEVYKSNSIFHEVLHLSCRPCSKIGFAKCPKGHFNCMQKQDMKLVLRD